MKKLFEHFLIVKIHENPNQNRWVANGWPVAIDKIFFKFSDAQFFSSHSLPFKPRLVSLRICFISGKIAIIFFPVSRLHLTVLWRNFYYNFRPDGVTEEINKLVASDKLICRFHFSNIDGNVRVFINFPFEQTIFSC